MNTKTAAHSPDEADPAEEPGYAEAMAELSRILSDLETGEPDVDVLAAQVERAAFLVGICRHRITAARLQIEQIIPALDNDDPG